MSTKTRFEKEAKGNSEMAYYSVMTRTTKGVARGVPGMPVTPPFASLF